MIAKLGQTLSIPRHSNRTCISLERDILWGRVWNRGAIAAIFKALAYFSYARCKVGCNLSSVDAHSLQ